MTLDRTCSVWEVSFMRCVPVDLLFERKRRSEFCVEFGKRHLAQFEKSTRIFQYGSSESCSSCSRKTRPTDSQPPRKPPRCSLRGCPPSLPPSPAVPRELLHRGCPIATHHRIVPTGVTCCGASHRAGSRSQVSARGSKCRARCASPPVAERVSMGRRDLVQPFLYQYRHGGCAERHD